MALTYRKKYGLDWPLEFSDLFIDMTVAKKWRLFEKRGIKIAVDPGECMERALVGLFPETLKMSPWTRTMAQDFAREDLYAMIGCATCGKSFLMAACGIAYWLTDPLNTAVVVGSATLKDLQSRCWAPVLTLFSEVKNNREGIPIPGKIVHNQYAIVNEKDESIAGTMAAKAAIQGRALEEGRLQGTHADWVLLIVDELALVHDIEALKESITNISIGTLGFKFVSAANPNPWESPNSCFYVPPRGVTVDENTGVWRSSMGYFVRHFDGLRSPVVLDPALKDSFSFLMSPDDVQNALNLCNGDTTHPRFWKMIRGFPRMSSGGMLTVLDPMVATANRVTSPPEAPMAGVRARIGLVAGVDPAWSENGDAAVYAGCEVVLQDGRPLLDFTGRTRELPLSTKTPTPMTRQLRDGVIAQLNRDGGPKLDCLYVDSSGNQGLADDLDIYVGPGCGHINASVRASELPLRAQDTALARSRVRDRGTEAWVVLAEFCRAGMVRGLPQRAADALVQRRFATRASTNDLVEPLRLEPKEEFIKRFKTSPNEADACALAALAVKERLGVLPYGSFTPAMPGAIAPQAYATEYGGPGRTPQPAADYDHSGFDDIGLFESEC